MYNYLTEHWTNADYAVIDVEGNGQVPLEIIEIAVVHVCSGIVQPNPKAWLVKPSKLITYRATLLHGITNEDLFEKPSFENITSELLPNLVNHIVIGHNVSVDMRLIRQKIPQWSPLEIVDTLKMARCVFPGEPSYTLEALCMAKGIVSSPNLHFHRAESDAVITAKLFVDMARRLDFDGQLSVMRLVDIAGAKNNPDRGGQQELF